MQRSINTQNLSVQFSWLLQYNYKTQSQYSKFPQFPSQRPTFFIPHPNAPTQLIGLGAGHLRFQRKLGRYWLKLKVLYRQNNCADYINDFRIGKKLHKWYPKLQQWIIAKGVTESLYHHFCVLPLTRPTVKNALFDNRKSVVSITFSTYNSSYSMMFDQIYLWKLARTGDK